MNLIFYYSRKGQNYFGGAIRSIDKGNTEICAEYIQRAVGGDLFELDTVKPYSEDYMTCTEEAKAELRANARPELKKMLTDIDKYDNIFICGPCWWGTYPCAIFTQIEALDFTGKRVFPLMTHEGSGLAGAPAALKKYCNGATVGQGLAVLGSNAKASEKTVADWAKAQMR